MKTNRTRKPAMTDHQITQHARAFLLWREGTAVNWDCTLAELAEAVDVPYRVAQHICLTRRWPVERAAFGPGGTSDNVVVLMEMTEAGYPPRRESIDRRARLDRVPHMTPTALRFGSRV